MLFAHINLYFVNAMRLCKSTMRIGRNRFNLYLLASLTLACVCGCQIMGKSEKDQLAELAIFLEVNPDMPELSSPVPIFRESPVLVNIEKAPFLTEYNVKEAKVVDQFGGFALQIKFDQEGTWLLEQYTSANPSRRLAISCRFGFKHKEVRWLGAPVIRKRISNGVLTFTPDATREEAEEIVLGLNNAAKEDQDSSKW